jgi:hypothetical protein
MFLASRYQSIHHLKFEAAASASQSQCSTILIWVRSCVITRSQSPEVFRTRTTLRQGKNVASEGGGLIGLCFRGTLSRKL